MESDAHVRELLRQILEALGAETQQEALREIAILKEKAGTVAVVMKHLGVNHHWQVAGRLKNGAK